MCLALLSFVFLLSFCVCWNTRWVLAAALSLLLNAVPVLSLYVQRRPVSAGGDKKVSLLQLNLFGGKNHDVDTTLALIKARNADVVGIAELTPTWYQRLRERLPEYRYQVVEPGFGGIGVLSKYPLDDAQIRYFGAIRRPRVHARMRLGNGHVTLLFVHPVIPLRRAETRVGEFTVIAGEAAAAKEPVILAGDLNSTPWSYLFEMLKENGSLIDSEQGYGPQPSWNGFWPFALFPIDHCLTSAEFSVSSRCTCGRIGSDHLPVFTELELHQ